MRRTTFLLTGLLLSGLLAGCGGMTRAVGVLPNTTDDLARKSEAFRNPAPAPSPVPPARRP
jgi:hypothetical protein